MGRDFQESLIEAIGILVDEAIKKTSYTSSHIGLVKEVKGFDCVVELHGSEIKCKMFEHLQTQIKVGDIVVVQDLYNDSARKFVQSKIGGTT